jgi:hypothetical protein
VVDISSLACASDAFESPARPTTLVATCVAISKLSAPHSQHSISNATYLAAVGGSYLCCWIQMILTMRQQLVALGTSINLCFVRSYFDWKEYIPGEERIEIEYMSKISMRQLLWW